MQLITTKITQDELKKLAKNTFGTLIKGVVDIEKKIMVLDAELHADEEKYLIEQGSKQDNLWGINLYPELEGDDFLEFDSMINVRPRVKNFSRGVEDPAIREKIRTIVNKLIEK